MARWMGILGLFVAASCGQVKEPAATIPSHSGTLSIPTSRLRLYSWKPESKQIVSSHLDGTDEALVLDFSSEATADEFTFGKDNLNSQTNTVLLTSKNGQRKFLLTTAVRNTIGSPDSSGYVFWNCLDGEAGSVAVKHGFGGATTKVKVKESTYECTIAGHPASLLTAINTNLVEVIFAQDKYLLELTTGNYARLPRTSMIAERRAAGTPITATAYETIRLGSDPVAHVEFAWTLKSPSDTVPRNGVLRKGVTHMDGADLDGKPLDDVFYSLPTWLRDGYHGPRPTRPTPQTRQEEIDQTEVQVFVADEKGVWELSPDGKRKQFKGVPSEKVGAPVFGLSVGGGDGVCYSTESGVVHLSYHVPSRRNSARLFINDGLAEYGQRDKTIDTCESTQWKLDGAKLTNNSKSVDLPRYSQSILVGTTSTSLAYLHADGCLVVADLLNGQVLSSTKCVEIAIWPH